MWWRIRVRRMCGGAPFTHGAVFPFLLPPLPVGWHSPTVPRRPVKVPPSHHTRILWRKTTKWRERRRRTTQKKALSFKSTSAYPNPFFILRPILLFSPPVLLLRRLRRVRRCRGSGYRGRRCRLPHRTEPKRSNTFCSCLVCRLRCRLIHSLTVPRPPPLRRR